MQKILVVTDSSLFIHRFELKQARPILRQGNFDFFTILVSGKCYGHLMPAR